MILLVMRWVIEEKIDAGIRWVILVLVIIFLLVILCDIVVG